MAEETVGETKTPEEQQGSAPSQNADPVQTELEKEKGKQQRTEQDKIAYNLRKKAEEAKANGLDPKVILGLEDEEKTADEVPDWYKREKAKETQKTALEMAATIADAPQRELVETYLKTRIVPSGNPEDDFRFALAAVNSVKNGQIAQMVATATKPKVTAAGGSQSVAVQDVFTPTEEEARMMRPPYNLSKEKIIAAREKAQK